jgi:DNA gyrase subunit A
MRRVVAEELEAVKDAYSDRRRTQIVRLREGEPKKSLLTAQDLLPEKTVWLVVTANGLISRTLDDKMPRLSGSEAPAWSLRVNTRHTLYMVNEDGQSAALSMQGIPEADKPSQGVPVSRISALTEDDRLAVLLTLPPKGERADGWHVLTATRQGMVKKSALSELPGPAANIFTLVRVNEGDELGWLRLTDGKSDILLVTTSGMAIRFREEDVRPMGLVAAGVMGIKLQEDDEVVGMEVLPEKGEVFMVASNGFAKRVALNQFPKQGRYGQGVVAWKLPANADVVGMTAGKGTKRVTLRLKKLAPKMTRLDAAPLQGRVALGKKIQELKAGDEIVYMTVPWDLANLLSKAGGGKKKRSSRGSRGTKSKGSSAGKKR